MGKALVATGVVVLVLGLLGFTPVADFLHVSLDGLFSNGHTYYRIVPSGQSTVSIPLVLLVAGLLFCGAGLVLQRRRKIR